MPTDQCGNGLQTRPNLCIRLSDEKPVLKSLCRSIEPVPVRLCKIECKEDCVLSSWSNWEPCAGGCGMRLRHQQHSSKYI